MKRRDLLWFAAGALSSAVAAIATNLLLPKNDQLHPYLVVHEDMEGLIRHSKVEDVATLSGRMLRECGANKFEMSMPGIDINGYSLLPITEENVESFECALKRGQDENFQLDIWMTRNSNAQKN